MQIKHEKGVMRNRTNIVQGKISREVQTKQPLLLVLVLILVLV